MFVSCFKMHRVSAAAAVLTHLNKLLHAHQKPLVHVWRRVISGGSTSAAPAQAKLLYSTSAKSRKMHHTHPSFITGKKAEGENMTDMWHYVNFLLVLEKIANVYRLHPYTLNCWKPVTWWLLHVHYDAIMPMYLGKSSLSLFQDTQIVCVCVCVCNACFYWGGAVQTSK